MADFNLVGTIHGVRVFGSAVVRVALDTASIVVAVSRIEAKPEAAFSKTREAAQVVNAYLHQAGIKDFGSSRITLSQEFRYANGEQRFIGYQAKIGFNVILREMDKVDGLLSGLIAAGANELTSVSFQTTRLKDLRADARRRAVAAAREKAELYCTAAGVTVGNVLAIEDVNPEVLSGRNEGHTYREPMAVDDAGEPGAIDPGAITVGAAVSVVFRIKEPAE
ncbi:MAG: SIMPL domain-containing protein [Planctomycetes bacterium]|nr:SIMPL domain-containing protein [Planctomycetota bacterium]